MSSHLRLSYHPYIGPEYMEAASAFNEAAKDAQSTAEKKLGLINAVISTISRKQEGMFMQALFKAEDVRSEILNDMSKPASHMNQTVSSVEIPALAH